MMEGVIILLSALVLISIGAAFALSGNNGYYSFGECISMIEKSIEITSMDKDLIESKIDACKLLFTEDE